MRYRLDVVARSVVDAVENAGGWLFDRVMAGWDVRVLVVEAGDVRPLRILGAETVPLDRVLDSGRYGRPPHAVAVAADLCQCNPRIREGLKRALGDSDIEVAVWGDAWPVDFGAGHDPVQHPLSVAARAFKAHALAAAALPEATVAATEVFRTGVFSSHALGADLVPLG